MKSSRRKTLLVSLLLITSPLSVIAAAKITPVADVTVLGGQYFLEGKSTAFDGNVDVTVVPVINFSPKTALLPLYQGSFRGTKDVEELVGGGTLTQTRLDNSLTLRFVHSLSPTLSVKTKLGYKMEMLKETVDESLSDGLFNYNRWVTGFELEHARAKHNVRWGYDYYLMRYPNYQSLASDPRFTDVGLTTSIGTDILDYNTHEVFVEHKIKLGGKAVWQYGLDLAYKGFGDQRIVQDSGSYSSQKRYDLSQLLTAGIQLPHERMILGLDGSFQYYWSNQNSYDADRTAFTEDYYNFGELHISPSLTINFGVPERALRTTLFWDFAFRKYTDRLAQMVTGEYTGSKLDQTFHAVGLRLKYPLFYGLSVKTSANYRVVSSNMKYEQNYRYNYDAVTYFFGFGWEY